ncbi:diacylglycerol kinase family protein [Botrimarina sp.]|uniref:diacylglycerol kinase family protein n=1 Tax=Botrimarina sp. TaxID=2795802 RepID=UPI0032F08931
MNDLRPKTWIGKFSCAFRGVWVGMRDQSSFAVHFPVAALVLALAWWRSVTWPEWLALLVCVTVVLSAEMFNSSIEQLSRAVTKEYDEHVRDALDIASGAVFVAVIGAVTVGVLILLGRQWP